MNNFIKFVKEHSLKKHDQFFQMNALLGELGELANVIKKEEFYLDFPSYQDKVENQIKFGIRKPFREMFVDEAGDVLFYFIQLLNTKEVTLEEIIEYQINKLNKQSEDNKRIFKK
jgi:NTP pyrophosphatase (non-canonical NTP hydrolase)